ncbi:hypothetical protein SIN8267_02544 [Sinobacterium norvegicum]|uniref:Stress-response A/B barrel domain-containing protein n=1 Tax=Sinobacterium norvegicum TaxID=1641715 RepID=A0ABN8EMF1_9GAMM|nr:Dabb family protein [Sinobacterium norvegicum]CAH0992424.1 hypothetical protein SIN8267_02544 [Sinobacterium norvegicum]
MRLIKQALFTLGLLLSMAYSLVAQAEQAINHTVYLWLKQPGNVEHRQQIMAAAKQLAAIEGVESLTTGMVVSSDRTIVDDSFDVAISMEFSSEQQMNSYLINEQHVAIVAGQIQPLLASIVVYDFALIE